jgi:hypothetical protein
MAAYQSALAGEPPATGHALLVGAGVHWSSWCGEAEALPRFHPGPRLIRERSNHHLLVEDSYPLEFERLCIPLRDAWRVR